MMRRPSIVSSRRGFTILEVLMAIFLGGLLLTAASSYLFGLFNLKTALEDRPAFEDHAKGVVRFLDFAFANAISEEDDEAAVSIQEYPGAGVGDDEVLSFRLNGELPLFVDQGQYLAELDCYLVFDEDEGLYLLWQSDQMADEDMEELRRTPLSPYVTSVTYAYYDPEFQSWEEDLEFQDAEGGGLEMPDMIRVRFTHPQDNREMVFDLLLPPEEADVPLV